MKEKMRKTGIDIIGDAPWGTHFCLFYKTKEDLIDILVPHFKAGLENNEFCMWVTSEPLAEKEAKKAMRKVVPNFDQYLKRGQIEIIPYTKWYLKDGAFDSQRVFNAWIDKLNQVLSEGYGGMRVTGNTAWLEKRDWINFSDYEEEVNRTMGKYQTITICSYSLDKCGRLDVIDVVKNHQFALVKREDEWKLIESNERKQVKQMLRQSEEMLQALLNAAPESMLLIDTAGTVLSANEPVAHRLGTSLDKLVGACGYDFLPPDVAKGRKKHVDQVIRTHKPVHFEDVCNDRYTDNYIYPIFDKEGMVTRLAVFGLDITQHKRAEEALQESEGKLSAMLGSIGDHMSMIDRDLNIIWANETAKKIFGNDIIGKKCYEAYHQREEPCESCITLQSFQDGGIHEHDTQVIGKDGQTIWFHCTANVALKDHRGNPTAVLEISRDITKQEQAEEAIKRLAKFPNEDPNPVLRVGGNGTVLYANQGSLPLLNLWECQIGQLLPEYWRKFILDILSSGLSKNIEVECEDHIFSLTFVPVLDANYVNLYGLDITQHKRVEETLRESEEEYKTLTESSLTGIFIHQDGKYGFVNDKFAEIHGYKPQELLGKEYLTLIHPDEREALKQIVSKRLKGKVVPQRYEVRRLRKDGKTIWCEMMATRIEYGGRPAIMGNIIDITERKRMEEALKASEQKYRKLYKKAKLLAERDPLTKLFNYRRIGELLENEIQRAKRKEEVFSIMMLDVDDLKLINDAYGHLVGDKLLKNIADILKNSCRSIDLIGRYGGDEFLIILPYTHGEKAKNIAQRICEKIQRQGLKINGTTTNIPFRLSIGVATYPFDSMISRELISLADRRMYESKQFGESVVSVSVPEVKEYLTAKGPPLNVLEGLVNAVDGKDHYTKAHSELVTEVSLSVAKELNLSHEEMEALRIAGLLHDIGKIGIPESILRKPGPLEREEFELIKQHPRLGAMMLDGPPPHRDQVIDAIKYHHERYDGKGYPGELKGKDIPLLARIIGIVDAYCAMITDRPYRKALTQEEAIAELKKGAGTQFDPELVDKFIRCLKERKI